MEKLKLPVAIVASYLLVSCGGGGGDEVARIECSSYPSLIGEGYHSHCSFIEPEPEPFEPTPEYNAQFWAHVNENMANRPSGSKPWVRQPGYVIAPATSR